MVVEDFSKEPVAGILRRIKDNGPITFAAYMGSVLYGEGGYYTSKQGRWGREGDYITSLDVSPVFARLLARQVFEMWGVLGAPAPFYLIEAGAGRGWLAKTIAGTARSLYPAFYGALKTILVEKNPNLREPPADNISWRGDITEAPHGVIGCVISNELIDSFPVHRVVREGGELKEIFTGFDGANLVDVIGPLSTEELAGYLKKAGVELDEGQRAEVNLEAIRWIGEAGALLERGFVITVDYGLPARELYAPERRDGTLLCHYRHTLNGNPYINIGAQDITTHVDFSTFVKAGAEAGLRLTGFATQKNFLLGLGICDELQEAVGPGLEDYERVRHNRELARLIAPGGMGDTFKVLVQHKGVERPALKGFSFRDHRGFL